MLLLASGLRFMGGFTLGVWIVPFYREAFPGEIGTEFALLKAAVNGVAGSVSAIGGGYLADRWSRTEPRAVVWLPAIGSVLAIPLWVGTLTAPTLTLSLACLFGEYLTAECWFGPVIAALQRAAPPGTQGLTQGSLPALSTLPEPEPKSLTLTRARTLTQTPSLTRARARARTRLARRAHLPGQPRAARPRRGGRGPG